MSHFELRSLPGTSWPFVPEGAMGQVWAVYLELERTQWLRPAEVEEGQLRQARTLLAHCAAHVPYYRGALAAAGVVPEVVRTMDDFRRLPLLSRRTYQEQLPALTAAQLPPGTVAAGDLLTSGSSGTPVRVLQTNVVHFWWHVFYLRDLAFSDVYPAGSLAILRSTGKRGADLEANLQGRRLPSWQRMLEPLLVTGPSYLMDVRQDPRKQLDWLRGLDPDYILSYPTNLEILAGLVIEDGRPLPRLKGIRAFSETLTPEGQARVGAAFGVPVKNGYSCNEAGYLASPCPSGPGLHVHAENVILEILDDTGRPVPPGQPGDVYVTSLHNFRAPLVRYELGDVATLAAGPCPCGRGLPLLSEVHGKRLPMFRLPDGGLKSPYAIPFRLKKFDGLYQYQVVQRAIDHVVVRLLTGRGWAAENEQQIRELVHHFFEAPVRVDVEHVERFERLPGGKFQPVVCEVADPAS